MTYLLLAICLLLGGGVLALLAGRWPRLSGALAAAGSWGAAAVAIGPVLAVLRGDSPPLVWEHEWTVPLGKLLLELDPLSAVFAIPVLAIPAIVSIYGIGQTTAESEEEPRGTLWFFYCLMSAAMLVVLLSRNGLLFIFAWETMSVASYLLVTQQNEKEEVRQAGFTYIVATHLGTAFLLAFFALWGQYTGSLDFLASSAAVSPERSSLLFLLAVVGFGTKAGLMPFHVWMPQAYPAAPGPAAALLSAVLVKMGVYGICRTIALVGNAQDWWAWLLIGLGCLGAIVGIMFALVQQDMKRLLAYSSVENVGIIMLGLGIGLLGMRLAKPNPLVVALGFGGALFHVWNHSLMKSLMFLCAGTVEQTAGTRQMDRLGGLLKRLPWTGTCFFVGSLAMCGLPPLCGFMSEFFLYYGALIEEVKQGPAHAVPSLAIIGGLALAGGLAAFAFTKMFGISFLGEPRCDETAAAKETNWMMCFSQAVLAAGCVVVGLSAFWLAPLFAPAIAVLSHTPASEIATSIVDVSALLQTATAMCGVFGGIVLLLAFVRWQLLSAREVGETGTWDCGYAQPTARMQYTATSFSQPAAELFSLVLRTNVTLNPPTGLFPQHADFTSRTPDVWQSNVYDPAAANVSSGLSWLRWVQHGQLHLYVLYIAVTLVVLLTALVTGWVS